VHGRAEAADRHAANRPAALQGIGDKGHPAALPEQGSTALGVDSEDMDV
jgi:hypothetical protein